MPPSLTILPITAEHDTQWLPLWLGYQRFYQTNIPDETTQLTWQRLLDPQEPMQAALASRCVAVSFGYIQCLLMHQVFWRVPTIGNSTSR